MHLDLLVKFHFGLGIYVAHEGNDTHWAKMTIE